MRLDLYLYKQGVFASRHQAQIAIRNGSIAVNKKTVTKPAHEIGESDTIDFVKALNPYISQGGLKLDAALRAFDIDLADKIVLDVGSSYGGFTDCALKNGAKKVYAVDVGSFQMHEGLRLDERGDLRENTNFLHTTPSDFDPADIVLIDVSFTSCIPMVSHVRTLFENPRMVVLIKPQFESLDTPKSGVIRDPLLHRHILENTIRTIKAAGLTISGLIPSPVLGQSGNREFLLHIGNKEEAIDIPGTVKQAWQLR